MPALHNGPLIWDLGVVVASFYDDDGFLGIQPDAFGEQSSGVHPYEQHQPHGFFSRCHDPDTDGSGNPTRGCTVLKAEEGGATHAWLCSDPRVLERLPQVAKGSGGIYGGPLGKDPGTAIFDGDDGSFALTVGYAHGPDGKPTKSLAIALDNRTPGGESITLTHGDGMSVTLGGRAVKVANAAGTMSVTVDDSGIVQDGIASVTKTLAVGPPGGLPVALAPAVLSAINGILAGLNAVAAAAGITAPASTIAAAAAASAVQGSLAAITSKTLTAG